MTTQADEVRRMADEHEAKAEFWKYRASPESKFHRETAAMLREYAEVLSHQNESAKECYICDGTGLVHRGVLAGREPCKACAPPKYSYGHCCEKNRIGGCQLHNLQCGYPDCDRRELTAALSGREDK